MGLFSGLSEALAKSTAKTGAKTVGKEATEAAAKKSVLATIKANPKLALGAAAVGGLALYGNTTGAPAKAIDPGQTVASGGQAVGATDPTGTATLATDGSAADDGSGSGSGSDGTTPATGGSSSMMVYGGLAVGALVLVIALLFVLKKRKPGGFPQMGMAMPQYFPPVQAYAPMAPPQPQFYPGMVPGRF